MFIIETGEVSITKKGRDSRGKATGEVFRIGRLGINCFFGELAVVGNAAGNRIRRRSAQVRKT
jgi:CRP-like cAMP-binding protein